MIINQVVINRVILLRKPLIDADTDFWNIS